jgi:hypothetical protein
MGCSDSKPAAANSVVPCKPAADGDDDAFFAEEGRRLLAASPRSFKRELSAKSPNSMRRLLNSITPKESPRTMTRQGAAHVIYTDPVTKAELYVGGAGAASSAEYLKSIKCTHVVCCQGSDGQMHFENDPNFTYLYFPIGRWRALIPKKLNSPGVAPVDVRAFFDPLFAFVEAAIRAKGANVLIHCLAGAHRAGVAGIASLMHLCGMGAGEATKEAQTRRPCIDPIASFPRLLELLQQGVEQAEAADNAAANANADDCTAPATEAEADDAAGQEGAAGGGGALAGSAAGAGGDGDGGMVATASSASAAVA